MEAKIRDKRIYCIINPDAGGGNSRIWWETTMPELDQRGYRYSWEYMHPGHIKEQVQTAVIEQGAEVIVVVGGDGSIFEVINAMVEQDKLIKEGLILVVSPTGSACDFARHIYPQQPKSLPDLLEHGQIHHIDLGCCCFQQQEAAVTKYYINSFDTGVGADTCFAVNDKAGKIKKILKNGQMAFMLTALKVLMTYKYCHARIELPEQTIEGEFIITGLGNGSYIGGGMKLFPHAALDDGLLDLLLIPRKSRLNILRLFPKVYSGDVINIAGTVYLQTPTAQISTQQPINIELDGEVPGTTDAEIRVIPKLLPLLLPVNPA